MLFDNKIISASEAKYKIEKDTITSSGGAQASYNLEQKFVDYVIKENILIENPDLNFYRTKNDIQVLVHQYVLNEENYKFKLGSGILWLIGDEYKDINNKFILSWASENQIKPQLYKKVYKEMGFEYEWFLDLYAKNLA